MRLGAEAIAMVLITFCFTVGAAYLWGYSGGKADSACYVMGGE